MSILNTHTAWDQENIRKKCNSIIFYNFLVDGGAIAFYSYLIHTTSSSFSVFCILLNCLKLYIVFDVWMVTGAVLWKNYYMLNRARFTFWCSCTPIGFVTLYICKHGSYITAILTTMFLFMNVINYHNCNSKMAELEKPFKYYIWKKHGASHKIREEFELWELHKSDVYCLTANIFIRIYLVFFTGFSSTVGKIVLITQILGNMSLAINIKFKKFYLFLLVVPMLVVNILYNTGVLFSILKKFDPISDIISVSFCSIIAILDILLLKSLFKIYKYLDDY